MKKKEPENILIVKLSAIGDVIHTLPFLEAIRDRFPGARIDWVLEEECSPIVKGHPALDRVLVSRRKDWQARFIGVRRAARVGREVKSFIAELRARRYDLVVDLQGLFKSAVLTALARGQRKIGPSGGRECSRLALGEPAVPVDTEGHAVERYLQVAGALGARTTGWKGGIPVAPEDEAMVDGMIRGLNLKPGRLAAINPMARWDSKLWDEDKFAVLADGMSRDLGLDVVLTGGASDRRCLERIRSMSSTKPVNLAGETTIKQLSCLYRRCALVVSTDTGPMHVAAASGRPVVALFGPTAPWRTGPYGPNHRVVRKDMECSPCFRKHCPHVRCMKSITPEEVLEAVEEVLAENGDGHAQKNNKKNYHEGHEEKQKSTKKR